jgi:hypothetical protein
LKTKTKRRAHEGIHHVSDLLFYNALSIYIGENCGGIEFPEGALNFADKVVSYDPVFPGGGIPHPDFMIPSDVLGIPDYPGGRQHRGIVSGDNSAEAL